MIESQRYPWQHPKVTTFYRLFRGNVISNEKFKGEKVICEIKRTNDHPAASFNCFLYNDGKLLGKLKWSDGREFDVNAQMKIRSNELFRFEGKIKSNSTNDESFILLLIPKGSTIKEVSILTGIK